MLHGTPMQANHWSGERFQNTIWAVIQQADVARMEKYLPVVQAAIVQGEIAVAPIKMMIDQKYGLKYGYQVFGTQDDFGLRLAGTRKRDEIQARY